MSEVKVNKITPTTNCGTVTLGDSGDTLAIPCGVTLSNAGSITNSGTITNTGTISGGTITGNVDGLVSWDTTAKTANFTAVAGNGYFVNTTSGAITVTLPASPSAGDLVGIKDYANTADTNNITIARNGSNIQGTANDFTISTEGLSIILIYVDGTQGWVSTGAAKASDIAEEIFFVTATGGTVTTCGDYKIHTFTGPGTFCVSCAGNAAGSNTVDYLVVAGGGGTAGHSGGGGAGGYRESSGTASGCYTTSPLGACVAALPVTVQGYPITVGGGGSAGGNPNSTGGKGNNSVFSSITSTGGGASASNDYSPKCFAGGSAGGGPGTGQNCGNTPPVSPPQGQNGGGGGGCESKGGGGGAGGAGGTATTAGGASGVGVNTSITASPVLYAEGGGGGARNDRGGTPSPTPAGVGGQGRSGNTPGGAGATNKGGGAGGGGNPCGSGGTGGSGVVIIRYKYQ